MREGKIVVNTSRVIASRVTQGTTTLSLLPSTKAVSGRGGGGGGGGGRLLPPLRIHDTLIRPSGFLGHGSTKGEHAGPEARSFLHYPHVRAGRHRAPRFFFFSAASPSIWWRRGAHTAGSRGRRASTSAQFFVLSRGVVVPRSFLSLSRRVSN